MNRTVIKVAGESGMGLASVGAVIAQTLKRSGFHIHSDREYPSLIKGGHSNVQIDFGPKPLHCLSEQVDIVVALDRAGLVSYLESIKEGGILIHGYERYRNIKGLAEKAKQRKVQLLYLPAREISFSFGGNILMTNMVLLGLLWKVLGLNYKNLEAQVKKEYADKPALLKIDLLCLAAGYEAKGLEKLPNLKLSEPKKKPETILLHGNHALALGAIHCGVRTYYAYPMSPSSSILTDLANWAHECGMLVKQGEDEITVAQMTLGSMFMGTRALAATSGGGFDLMTETVSLAAMTETPFVMIIAQRPGPATGLPTWTAQADLNMALHSSHGEFSRVIIAVSDPTSAFELIQHAMNIAEEYQTVVILLTEKVIAESFVTVPPFKQKTIPIKRGLVTGKQELSKLKREDRYALTKSGISKRWIPGSSETFYFGQGDEHDESGTLTEEAKPCEDMQAKRLRKHETVKKALPEPKIHGPKKADISFIGWGSTKGAMLDAMEHAKQAGISMNYLHFDYLWPLKTKTLLQFCKDNKNVHIAEGNSTGQLANLIQTETELRLSNRLLKYNGRPFFLEDILNYLKKQLKKKK